MKIKRLSSVIVLVFLLLIVACTEKREGKQLFMQKELQKIAMGQDGIEKNYEKAKQGVEKTKDDYFKGSKEQKAFADAQAKLIVAAAKTGRIEEAERVYQAAHRSGVANENVYLARDLAKKIAKEQKKSWLGSFN